MKQIMHIEQHHKWNRECARIHHKWDPFGFHFLPISDPIIDEFVVTLWFNFWSPYGPISVKISCNFCPGYGYISYPIMIKFLTQHLANSCSNYEPFCASFKPSAGTLLGYLSDSISGSLSETILGSHMDSITDSLLRTISQVLEPFAVPGTIAVRTECRIVSG